MADIVTATELADACATIIEAYKHDIDFRDAFIATVAYAIGDTDSPRKVTERILGLE